MKVFFNRTQLARRLQMAPETLRERIKSGIIEADAKDARGGELFSESVVTKYEKKNGDK